jgi:hypothetical protein
MHIIKRKKQLIQMRTTSTMMATTITVNNENYIADKINPWTAFL